ncbi:hypothetical protein D3C80_1323700 [compost metagenome]
MLAKGEFTICQRFSGVIFTVGVTIITDGSVLIVALIRRWIFEVVLILCSENSRTFFYKGVSAFEGQLQRLGHDIIFFYIQPAHGIHNDEEDEQECNQICICNHPTVLGVMHCMALAPRFS